MNEQSKRVVPGLRSMISVAVLAVLLISCEIVSGIEPTVVDEGGGADAATAETDAGTTADAAAGMTDAAVGMADAAEATCSSSTCIAGSCEVARCEGSKCVIESACTDDEMCCAGTCVPMGCDDGNTCTDDACGQDGCEHAPNTVSCDDGVFCNGSDTCMDGTCAVHPGSPCAGSTICNEGMNTCVGCLTDTDCPGQTLGAWGECEGFADTCDLGGTHSRSVITYACVDDVCVPSNSTETETCSRSTDGFNCGGTTFGAWSACGGFSGTCDESGTRTRTRTDSVCSAGACTAVNTIETESCARDQEGKTCDSAQAGAWSTCGGFTTTCDESGTQSRQIRTPICSNGACSGESVSTETRSCSKDTDGDTCDTVYSAWSACGGFSSTDMCDETGSRSRTVTTKSCQSGGCTNTVSQTTQSQSCTVNKDGRWCAGYDNRGYICVGTCRSGFCGDLQDCEP